MLKMKNTNGRFYFEMSLKLNLIKYEVSLVKLEGKAVKLINLID